MNSLQTIRKLKKENRSPRSFIKGEAIGVVEYHLRPVRSDINDATIMAKWRSNVFESFFTWIKPSSNDILQWLRCYEENDRDIIFIIELESGIPIGQMSIYNINIQGCQAEFGRVILGKNIGIKGIMTFAGIRLFEWAFNSLGLGTIFLEVFSNNESAVSLYKRLGFSVQTTCLFQKTLNQRGVMQWVQSSEEPVQPLRNNQEFREVHKMVLGRQTFFSMEK